MKSILVLSSLFSFAVAQSNFICYFPNWSTYRTGIGKYTVANIDPSKCTHIIYAFAVLDPTSYTMSIFDSWADISLGGYANAVALKQKNPKLKVMIAIGGWNDSVGTKYSTLVSSAAAISNFATTAVSFLRTYGFDGLDIDWEYPSSPAEKAGFTALTKALKSAFQPYGFLLTAAVAASTSTADNAYDLPQLALYVDFLNVMSYDMHGSWETTKADHHAPLYKRTFEADGNNIDYVIKYFIGKGFPASKINMGIPLYGRGWTLSGTTTTLPAPANGASPMGQYTQELGYLGYYEACLYVKNGWTKVSDPAKLNGPYIYSLSAKSWFGYDDADMAAYKVSYIQSKGLAGAMVWDISLDDFTNACGGGANPVISAIYNALSNGTTVTTTIAPTSTTKATTKATATTTIAPTMTTKVTATTTIAPTTTTKATKATATTTKAAATTTKAASTTTKAPTTTTKATGTATKATATTTIASTTTTKATATTTKAPTTTAKVTTKTPSIFVCPGDGLYPDPTTCTKFYNCANGIAYSMSCSSGLYFNPTLKVCDWPVNVPSCNGR